MQGACDFASLCALIATAREQGRSWRQSGVRRSSFGRLSGHLNADVPVAAVASANQVSRRFEDARVVLEDVLHPDSDEQCAGHAVAAWPHHSVH